MKTKMSRGRQPHLRGDLLHVEVRLGGPQALRRYWAIAIVPRVSPLADLSDHLLQTRLGRVLTAAPAAPAVVHRERKREREASKTWYEWMRREMRKMLI